MLDECVNPAGLDMHFQCNRLRFANRSAVLGSDRYLNEAVTRCIQATKGHSGTANRVAWLERPELEAAGVPHAK